jgi:hypothetical protein
MGIVKGCEDFFNILSKANCKTIQILPYDNVLNHILPFKN